MSASSWVATRAVIPSERTTLSSSSMICRPVSRSSWLVGSSAISRPGRPASARAMATRCCWPPESSPGRCAAWLDKPVSASMAAIRSRRSLGRTPAMRSGIPTFSAADSMGMSPKDWKMKATVSRRSASRSRSVIRLTSRPSTHTWPAVGLSRPPMMFSSVVLPEPDRPRKAVSRPRPTVNDTPRRACTAVCPLPKVREIPSAATMTCGGWPAVSVPSRRMPGRSSFRSFTGWPPGPCSLLT